MTFTVHVAFALIGAVVCGLLTILLSAFAILEIVGQFIAYSTFETNIGLVPLPAIVAAVLAVVSWRGARACWEVFFDEADL